MHAAWGCAMVGLTCFLTASRAWAADCVPPPAGLVAWWSAEGNANDIAGTNNGTLLNGATFAPGIVGQAFSFDGVDDVIQVPSSLALSFANSPMTVELWAYRTGGAPIMHFIGKRTACAGDNTVIHYQLYFNMLTGQGLAFGSFADEEAASGLDMPMNTWTHLAGTFDGSNLCLYVNGILKVAKAGASLGQTNAAQLLIGGSADCPPFAGLIDEVSIYNRALSASEIFAIYEAGSAGKCQPFECVSPPAGLVGWWPGEGNADDMANTNNGRLLNGASFATGEVGSAFNFHGGEDSVAVPDSPNLRLTTQFTLEAWIYPRSAYADQCILAKVGISGGNNGYEMYLSYQNWLSGQFNSPGQSWPGNVIAYSNAAAIVPLVWYHVAWTYDQSAMKLYLNGLPVVTNVIGPHPIAVSTNSLRISGVDEHNTVFFNGLIDEPAVFSRALSDAEIRAIYAAGSAGKCPVPVITGQPRPQVGYWGKNATFSVRAVGGTPLNYQWLKDGIPIEGATGLSLVVTNLQVTNAGNYSVVVTNA
jgi:hypothetical protein